MDEYQKIVSISSIRSTILNGFVSIVFLSWIVAMIAILFRKHISKIIKKQHFYIKGTFKNRNSNATVIYDNTNNEFQNTISNIFRNNYNNTYYISYK